MRLAPTPWSTGTDEDANIVYDANLDFVAATDADDGDAEIEANHARLIAAAPDLLAACKRAKELLDKSGLDWLGKDPDPLEAAIAKAEGK